MLTGSALPLGRLGASEVDRAVSEQVGSRHGLYTLAGAVPYLN